MRTVAQYLKTLQRIPDDVILSMATRPIDLPHYDECVCGWLARETAARQQNVDAADPALNEHDGIYLLAREYGGGVAEEWMPINGAFGEFDASDALEEAFVERVLECVS